MEASSASPQRSGHVWIKMPSVESETPRDGMLKEKSRARAMWLNFSCRAVAFMEWIANGTGGISIFWTGSVVLGAFCSQLVPLDFWSATGIIFIEAFRFFNRENKLGSTSWFQTRKSLRKISLPLGSKSQHRDVAFLLATLFVNSLGYYPIRALIGIAVSVLTVLLFKLKFPWDRCHWCFFLWVLLFSVIGVSGIRAYIFLKSGYALLAGLTVAGILQQVISVLLVNLTPQMELVNAPCFCKVLYLVKLITALCLIISDPWTKFILRDEYLIMAVNFIGVPFSMLILSISSLQTLEENSHGRRIDAALQISLFVKWVSRLSVLTSIQALLALFLVSLFGNLQVPTSIACLVVSVWRLQGISAYGTDGPNLQRALYVFYYLVIWQSTIYIAACLLDASLTFLRKSVIQCCGLRGKHGTKFIDLYYEHVYTEYMEGRVRALDQLDLPSFAVEALTLKSSQMQLNGLKALHNFLLQKDTFVISKISNSTKSVTQLVRMIGWTGTEHKKIRVWAIMVVAELSPRLRISCVPGTMDMLSSLLDCEDLKDYLETTDGSNNRGTSMENRYPTLGLFILQRLACQVCNREEISKASGLLPKIVVFTSYTSNTDSTNIVQQQALLLSSLTLVKILARTGGKIGLKIRKDLSENISLLTNLTDIFDDIRTDTEILEQTIQIISMLAMDMNTRREIVGIPVIMRRLMHIFLEDGSSNYNPALCKLAGGALAILTIENTRNNLTILKDPRYNLIQDLEKMLLEKDYSLISASILTNLCAYSRSELCRAISHEQLPSLSLKKQLPSPIHKVMELLLQAEGKELEVFVRLASQIRHVIPICFAQYLESHTNAGILIQKLVSELNARKNPSVDCPGMRRVVVELVTSVVEACPSYAILFREQGMMDALDRVQQNPSRLENFRIIYGGEGVISESCDHLSTQVAKAKKIIGMTRP